MAPVVKAPLNFAGNETLAWIFFVVGTAAAVGLLIWGLVKVRRDGDWAPLLIILGGGIVGLFEPVFDALFLTWWPNGVPGAIFHTFAAHEAASWYFIPSYATSIGGGLYVGYLVIRELGSRGAWLVFWGFVLGDTILEIPVTSAHLASYYGPQPLQPINGAFPIYVGFMMGAWAVAGSAMLAALLPRLKGRSRILCLVVPPIVVPGTYFATGWPVALAFGAKASEPVIYLCAIVTLAFAISVAAICAQLTPERMPETETEPAPVPGNLLRLGWMPPAGGVPV